MQENLKLTAEQKLQQRLSPLQVQYVHMLEMNRIEVEEKVRHELDDNPALEVTDAQDRDSGMTSNEDEAGEQYNESAEQMQLADYRDEDDIPSYRLNISNAGADDDMPEATVVAESSIIDYLEEQISERELSPVQNAIAGYIIGNIDDNGYLQRSIDDISDDIAFQTGLDVSVEDVNEVLQIVHELEPAGIGASNLRECMLLQLERRSASNINMLAYKVVDKYFDEFSKKHYGKIMSGLSIDEDTFRKVVNEIHSLNPKPGSAFSGAASETHSQQIIPDFLVETDGDTLQLTLLNNLPELQIEESFDRMYNNTASQTKGNGRQNEAAAFVKQKYESASNFIKILRQRQETLYATMRAIVKIQSEFFFTGEESSLKPMRLKDIADITGQDLSIISRAANNKYVSTQWGVFPLKYFFNESMSRDSGEEVSSREVQAILKKVIAEENKDKPYSDEQLCAILKKNGYEIARRTVAKYREKLGLPVARLRKEL